MSTGSYTLKPDEKATQVMIGTSDMLLWGDLVTKEHVRVSTFLSTLAEDFVPLHDVKILLLAPTEQIAPLDRPQVYVKQEEILLFYTISDQDPLPQETEVRRFEAVEAIVGSYRVEGMILKSPIATLLNLLIVSRDAYMPIYQAQIRHVAKPWLNAFSTNLVQVRRDRLTMTIQ
jgi:hypothetical protein